MVMTDYLSSIVIYLSKLVRLLPTLIDEIRKLNRNLENLKRED